MALVLSMDTGNVDTVSSLETDEGKLVAVTCPHHTRLNQSRDYRYQNRPALAIQKEM
jgi:hypothetical protein